MAKLEEIKKTWWSRFSEKELKAIVARKEAQREAWAEEINLNLEEIYRLNTMILHLYRDVEDIKQELSNR
jgi:hypothetical protein